MELVGGFAGEAVEQVSVDEAYLEVTEQVGGEGGHDEMIRRAVPMAEAIKAAVRRERGLAATIGVGPNKLTAKIASSSFKPVGLTVVRESGKAAFLRLRPAGAIPGLGKVLEVPLDMDWPATGWDITEWHAC